MEVSESSPKPPQTERGRGCARLLGVGCLALLGLVAVAGVAVLLNLDTIRESSLFQQAVEMKDEVTRSLEVRKQLAIEFPAQAIGVAIENSKDLEDQRVRIVRFEFTNPEFLPEDPQDWRPMAKGIARRITELHPTIEDYNRIEISFSRAGGSVVTYETGEVFSFEISEFLETSSLEASSLEASDSGPSSTTDTPSPTESTPSDEPEESPVP